MKFGKLTAVAAGILALTGLSASGIAHAKCDAGSKALFYCVAQKSGKVIELCDAGKTIGYSFGKPQSKPDIVLSVPRNQASTYQWDGMGRERYWVNIPNGDTVYSVFADTIQSGVSVEVKGKHVATVICSEKSIENNLEGVKLKPAD